MFLSCGFGSIYMKSVFYDEIGFGIFLFFNFLYLIWLLIVERLWLINWFIFYFLREVYNVNVGGYIDFVSKIFNFCI